MVDFGISSSGWKFQPLSHQTRNDIASVNSLGSIKTSWVFALAVCAFIIWLAIGGAIAGASAGLWIVVTLILTSLNTVLSVRAAWRAAQRLNT